MLRLACYFPADKPCFVSVNIDSDEYVYRLLKVIHEELKAMGHDVPLWSLRLYQVRLLLPL